MVERRQYDRVFKLSAVRLLEESALPLVQVARSLGIHDSMLRRWRSQVKHKGDKAFDQTGRYQHSELAQLRRENRRLKRDLEMVKKTLVLLEKLRR